MSPHTRQVRPGDPLFIRVEDRLASTAAPPTLTAAPRPAAAAAATAAWCSTMPWTMAAERTDGGVAWECCGTGDDVVAPVNADTL